MNQNLKAWTLLLTLSLIWGSSFILMKLGMYGFDGKVIFSDTQVASLRMAIASIILLPFGFIYRKKIQTLSDFIALTVVGTCGNFIPAFLFTFAETKLSSSMAGMLNSFTPFFTLFIGMLFFNQKTNFKQLSGMAIAFIGMCVLVGIFHSDWGNIDLTYIAAILCATLLYGISLNTIKYKLSHFKAYEIASLSFSILLLPSLFTITFFDVPSAVIHQDSSLQALFFIALLSVFGTCLALLMFNKLVAMKTPLFASAVTYFIPIVALFLGILFYHEQLDVIQLFGLLIVIAGVLVMNVSTSKSTLELDE
jgi:drug/metabolite transporter (DMT)-like permease